MSDENWGATDDSSGLLGDFEGTVIDSHWGTNPEAQTAEQRAKVQLYWTVSVDDVHQADYDGEVPEEITQTLSIGTGWETEDNETVEHSKGKSKFKSNTTYAMLLNLVTGKASSWSQGGVRVKVSDGGDEIGPIDLTDVLEEVKNRGTDKTASIWKGLRFRFRGVTFEYAQRNEPDNPIRVNKSVPVGFLGVGEDEPGQPEGESVKSTDTPESQTTPADPTPPEQEVQGNSDTGLTNVVPSSTLFSDAPDKIKQSLFDLIATSKSYREFQKKAVALPGVTDCDETLKDVLNETRVWKGGD